MSFLILASDCVWAQTSKLLERHVKKGKKVDNNSNKKQDRYKVRSYLKNYSWKVRKQMTECRIWIIPLIVLQKFAGSSLWHCHEPVRKSSPHAKNQTTLAVPIKPINTRLSDLQYSFNYMLVYIDAQYRIMKTTLGLSRITFSHLKTDFSLNGDTNRAQNIKTIF